MARLLCIEKSALIQCDGDGVTKTLPTLAGAVRLSATNATTLEETREAGN